MRTLTLDHVLSQPSYGVDEFSRGYLEGKAAQVRPDVNFIHHMYKSIEVVYLVEYEQRFKDMKYVPHLARSGRCLFLPEALLAGEQGCAGNLSGL